MAEKEEDSDYEEGSAEKKAEDIETQKVKDDHYDEAVELSDSGENIESEDSEEPEIMPNEPDLPSEKKTNFAQQQVQDLDYQPTGPQLANQYNPLEYQNLNVSAEVSELFEYINRYKPHHLDLDSQLKPFIPDFIPAVGEVDAFMKVPRPDSQEESTGLVSLDEPNLAPTDPTVLEMQYLSVIKVVPKEQIQIRTIEEAEKNPAQIQQWVDNLVKMKKDELPQSVQYSKHMPDIEDLMQEWPQEMEDSFANIPFPGPEIGLSVAEYSKVICSFLDIPIHNLANKKSTVEALHVLFTLFHDFKQNPHFHQKIENELQEDYLHIQ